MIRPPRGRQHNKQKEITMFKVEVIADNSGKWCGNGLTFETREAAEKYARDLFSRWTAVREWRVVTCETNS
jgi:hypothetical protein